MPQHPLYGLAKAGRMLLSRLNIPPIPQQEKKKLKLQPVTGRTTFTLPDISAPLQKALQDIGKTVSRLVPNNNRDDYAGVVKNFLPSNASLLTPKYSVSPMSMQRFDIDKDTENELIASYDADGKLRTMVLKKQKGAWAKIAEIEHPGYDSVRHRSIFDLTKSGCANLLMGLDSKGQSPTLLCYSIDGGTAKTLLSRTYSRYEVFTPQGREMDSQLAVWTRNDDGSYDIELLRWNGNEFETVGNEEPYYSMKAVPYFVRKIKSNPYNPPDWYGLSDALLKSGAGRNARAAADIGLGLDRNSVLKEKFLELKSKM